MQLAVLHPETVINLYIVPMIVNFNVAATTRCSKKFTQNVVKHPKH